MNNIEEDDFFEVGRVGERLVAEMLVDDGWSVIQTYLASKDKKPPILCSNSGTPALPDILTIKGDRQVFVEVKWKGDGAVPFWQEGGELRHGYDKYNYEDYMEVNDKTGIPIWVFVIEGNTGKVLRKNIVEEDPIQTPEAQGDYENGMVLYRRKNFVDTGVEVFEVETGSRKGHRFEVKGEVRRYDIKTGNYDSDFERKPVDYPLK